MTKCKARQTDVRKKQEKEIEDKIIPLLFFSFRGNIHPVKAVFEYYKKLGIRAKEEKGESRFRILFLACVNFGHFGENCKPVRCVTS